MSHEPQDERLKALDARLKAAQAKATPDKPHTEEHYSQAQLAWRMVIELVAGLGIGFGIGYGLDLVLGTTPWLMAIFTLLGFAAGMKTVIRSAEELQRTQIAASDAEDEDADGKGQRRGE